MIDRLRHIRRGSQMARGGWWAIRCDCGWSDRVSAMAGPRVKPGHEVEAQLEAAFVDHLPPAERALYLLVDQRLVPTGEGDEVLPTGNFIMPEGRAVMLTSWRRDEDDVAWGSYFELENGAVGELPVGEVRFADGRVFRLDTPA